MTSGNHVSYTAYTVKPVCAGCGRKLGGPDKEPALWLQGHPRRQVFGYCCWQKGAKP